MLGSPARWDMSLLLRSRLLMLVALGVSAPRPRCTDVREERDPRSQARYSQNMRRSEQESEGR